MKAPQVVISVGVLLAIIFGLTFLTQYTRKSVERKASKSIEQRAAPLYVPEKVAVWSVASPDAATAKYENAEFEKGTKGHYDFWVTNPNATQVAVRLQGQSCTCFDLQLGIIPNASLASVRSEALSRQALLAASLGAIGAPELAVLGSMPDLANVVEWHPLNVERDRPPVAVMVPPADKTHGPQLAVIRFGWVVQTPKMIRLTAAVQHQFENNLETTEFEVPLAVVPPLMVVPPLLQFGELNFNDQREATIVAWSATRPSIDVRVENVSQDPCIEVGAPTPMSEQELIDYPQILMQAGMISQPTKIRCGYKIKVTVFERRGARQLDLGLFGRRLIVKVGPNNSDDDMPVVLTGSYAELFGWAIRKTKIVLI